MTADTGTALAGADIAAIARDPAWFPVEIDPLSTALSFVHTERAALSAAGALGDGHWDTSVCEKRQIELAGLASALGDGAKPKLNFIWHTAYCCSTLLSRLIDVPGHALSLKEPRIMVVLANAKRSGHFGLAGRERLAEIVLGLLGRRFPSETAVTIKPAPASNYLIRDAAALTDGRMLFLYCDCASFLAAIARQGENRRSFARRTYALIVGDGNEQQRWPKEQVFELSDLQIAALVWHMQIAEFRRSWPLLAGRAASLDCEDFLERPEESLVRLDEFFALGLGKERLNAALDGPLMSQHAKRAGESYSIAQRRTEVEALDTGTKQDIADIVEWSYRMCPSTPQGRPLPDSLLDGEKASPA